MKLIESGIRKDVEKRADWERTVPGDKKEEAEAE
jgi:hypothetical protein